MKKKYKLFDKEFTKGALFMFSIFIVSLMVLGVYAFQEPGGISPGDGNFFIDTNSPLLKIFQKLETVNDTFVQVTNNITTDLQIIKQIIDNTSNSSGNSMPTCNTNQTIKYNGTDWECTTMVFDIPTCLVGEALVKSATGWECKSETLFGKEKMNFSEYLGTITITGFDTDILNVSDDDPNTNIFLGVPAGTMGLNPCGYSYASINDIPGEILIDFGSDYTSKFGLFTLSGEINVVGGDNTYKSFSHIPGVSCTWYSNPGGFEISVKVFSSADGTNWVSQGSVSAGNADVASRTNTFTISGSISGRYIKLQATRGNRCTSYGKAEYSLSNFEIYYNTF